MVIFTCENCSYQAHINHGVQPKYTFYFHMKMFL